MDKWPGDITKLGAEVGKGLWVLYGPNKKTREVELERKMQKRKSDRRANAKLLPLKTEGKGHGEGLQVAPRS